MVPVPLTVPPVTAARGLFSTGIGSPVTIDSSTARRAFDDDAVDRNALAGPDAEAIADLHVLERNVVLGAICLDPPGRLRRQAEQAADRAARPAARAQLQHLSEQHEHDDDGGRLEVDRRPRPCMRKDSGNSPGASVATTLYRYAAPTPSAISVNMLRCRLTIDAQPRTKNGQPPQSTTGVASANSIHVATRGGIACCSGCRAGTPTP